MESFNSISQVLEACSLPIRITNAVRLPCSSSKEKAIINHVAILQIIGRKIRIANKIKGTSSSSIFSLRLVSQSLMFCVSSSIRIWSVISTKLI